MAGRRTNLALLVLLAAAVATGALMYAVGTGWNRWPTIAHGAVGLALLALTPWKSVIARRGVRRRGEAAAPSLVLAALVVLAVAMGFVHRAGVRDLGPVNAMQVHVGAALAAVPLAVWHVVRRPVRPRVSDLSRRNLLRAGALAAGATAATVVLPHASGRFTRSLERGSGDPSAMPVTQWFDDDVARIDAAAWRLRAGGREWSLAALAALAEFDDVVVATLDCTGGWYATQEWRGVRLDRLLGGDGASVVVRSATGYQRRFPVADLDVLLLATHVGGQPLSAGHGAPARLVAPGRRGFWWVKWVTEIELSDRPWWWQSPFPLT